MAYLFLIFPFLTFAASAEDPAWLALLHFTNGESSIAEGASFFLSPEGHKDAGKELQATLEYFEKSPSEAACRFPARAIYLKREPSGHSDWCERWSKWREAVSAKGIELVFAAAFINSPSSMYGHTLLKFPRSGRSEGQELLDYTLNYGADTGNVVGAPYVWKGLTGGFKGYYATAPFYLKVKEYNFVENRDFWIYPLKVNSEELRLLVAHAWELREVPFPYYFLRKNCSYYLLEFLEVARPGSHLTKSFPFWAVPMDTIRKLRSEGWIEEARYRPSRYTLLKEQKEKLSGEDMELVEAILAEGEIPALPSGREAILLDAAYDLWRYRSDGKNLSQEVESQERRILQARAKVQRAAISPAFEKLQAPDLGHSTSRVSFSVGSGNHLFGELSYRGTLHDLLSPSLGYEEYSELTMGDIRVRWEENKIFLEQVDVLRLRSLSPRERWIPKTAWSFRIGGSRAKEFQCEAWHCFAFQMSGGAGLSTVLGNGIGFGLLELSAEAGKPFDKSYRVSGGPTVGAFHPLWKNARAMVEGVYRFRILGEKRTHRGAIVSLSQSIAPQWEVRVQAQVIRSYEEASVGVFHYF